MQIGPIVIESAKNWPFYREVHRLISEHPEYAEGIERGIVHLHFDPGYREAIRAKRKAASNGGSRADGCCWDD